MFGGYDDDEEPLDSGPVIISETFEAEADAEAKADEPETIDGGDNDSDEEEQNGIPDDLDNVAPMEEDGAPAPASAKKRGRPSLSASRTSTPAKTPKSAKSGATSAASSGRKRKAVDSADEPPLKRSGRATAAAAQDAIKESSKKRTRAPNGSAKPKPVRLCFCIHDPKGFRANVSILKYRLRLHVASPVANPRITLRSKLRTTSPTRSMR